VVLSIISVVPTDSAICSATFERLSFVICTGKHWRPIRIHEETALANSPDLLNSKPAAITAGIRPELFNDEISNLLTRRVLIIVLTTFVIAGVAVRMTGIGSEGLSDDELNKLMAVNEYRTRGLTGANGEHPFLMKALLGVSLIASEHWNQTSLVASRPHLNIPVETALRVPGAIFGAVTVILLFLVAAELFGSEVGLIAAALWTFDPLVIGFSRIAKEDTFFIFFFLLACLFWLRSQRVAETESPEKAQKFYWLTAAAMGAMLASKLIVMMIAIPISYNYVFQKIPATRWVIGKPRFIRFFIIMGIVFVILSPTILLPETWKSMADFSSSRVIGHDSYEFVGRLYPHRVTDWLRGTPWYFYFVQLATRLPLVSFISFVVGCAVLWRKKLGDGRYFLYVWLVLWGLAFMFVGGKFARYITTLMPAVFITAAIAIQLVARHFAQWCAQLFNNQSIKIYAHGLIPLLVVQMTIWSAVHAAPHYRLYYNPIAGGRLFFPQDDFYDAYMQQTMAEIAQRASPNAHVASETPNVCTYYAGRANRPDLQCLEFSDPNHLKQLQAGDFVIDARGRTYFSNQAMLMRLRNVSKPAFTVSVGQVPAADVYVLDQKSLVALFGS
jgi:predicted membrane-bound dolichyl-phosphate-mannose-protein mannosyltransferase